MEEKEIVIHVDWENKEVIVSDDLGTGYEAEVTVDNEQLYSVVTVATVTTEEKEQSQVELVKNIGFCAFCIFLLFFLIGLIISILD